MRQPICLGLALLGAALFASPAAAQEISIEEAFGKFRQACSRALSDPDAYLDALPHPGPAGERVTSVSPDGGVVSVFLRDANIYEEVEVYRLGERVLVDCSVIGEFYDQPGDEIAARIAAILKTDPNLSFVGGQTAQDYSGADGNRYDTVEDIYLYAVDGLWPSHGLPTVIHIVGGELQMYVDLR